MSCGVWLSPASWHLDRMRFGRLAVIRAVDKYGAEADEKAGEMQRTLDDGKLVEDFVAAGEFMLKHPQSTGKLGAVGFCGGGARVNLLAVRIAAACCRQLPFYGRAPAIADVPKIKAALLLHFAEQDPNINGTWPDYEAALKANGIKYEAYIYPKTNHGFHNDTTPRYDEAAAKLAWQRTIDHFNKTSEVELVSRSIIASDATWARSL